jgi:hypothetical protein
VLQCRLTIRFTYYKAEGARLALIGEHAVAVSLYRNVVASGKSTDVVRFHIEAVVWSELI